MEYIGLAVEYIEFGIAYSAWLWQGLAMAQQLMIAFGSAIVGIFGIAAIKAGR